MKADFPTSPPSAGKCGPCTACCTVMKVDMEPPKPERTPCAHLCDRKDRPGCAIYDRRPEPCRVFQCLWLFGQDMPSPPMRGLRPDLSGIVIEVNSRAHMIAHCAKRDAWKRRPAYDWLIQLAQRTAVLIDRGDDAPLLLNMDGRTEQLEFIGVSPETNERLYKREIKQ